MPHGEGIFVFANGGRVSGTWKNGVLASGEGIYIAADSSRHNGTWKNNVLVATRPAP